MPPDLGCNKKVHLKPRERVELALRSAEQEEAKRTSEIQRCNKLIRENAQKGRYATICSFSMFVSEVKQIYNFPKIRVAEVYRSPGSHNIEINFDPGRARTELEERMQMLLLRE